MKSKRLFPPSATPTVTIILVARNEEEFIGRVLRCLFRQNFPLENMEILVVDGDSSDRTRDVVREWVAKFERLQLLSNPKRYQSSGFNLGLSRAHGEYVIRLDCHTLYGSNYVRKSIAMLEEKLVQCAGPLQRAAGRSYWGRGMAIAMKSRFGVGDASFRYSKEDQFTDTVYLGAWKLTTLRQLGGFDESWVINEDYEMHYRLRQMGGKILVSPSLRCRYFVRETLSGIARQYFRYGFWKVKTLVAYPTSLRWRQTTAPLLVLSLLASLALLPVVWQLAVVVPGIYSAAVLVASLIVGAKRKLKYAPTLPAVFATLHLSYGIGFICGLWKWGIPTFNWTALTGAFQQFRRPSGTRVRKQ